MTADRLARDLPRLHPSFRFEEALAARLATAAAAMRLPNAVGADGAVVPLAVPAGRFDPLDDYERAGFALDEADDATRPGIGRPLLIGGALTSAALSLAGAAYVAWRLKGPPASPMVRAVRAVARTRPV
jgi:hypothetical protein